MKMSEINWDITDDEINEFNSSGDLKNNPYDVNVVKGIASKMQYLSSHKHNEALGVNDKLAYFHSYEKSRMDFLADIATATPTMESSKLFYGELIAGIDKNRVLLDRISGIDNFKYQIKLHDCRHCDKSQCSNNCRREISLENDFAVAIPNDIVGQHAFYIIIENIIRNTAKHSAKPADGLVTFHIEVREPDNTVSTECPKLKGYYEIHIYDSIDVVKPDDDFEDEDKAFFKQNGLDKIDGKPIEQIDKIDGLEKLVYRQNIFINLPLLKDDNELRQSAWGMIEMEAAAAYLRKIPVEDIDDDKYDLQLSDLFAKDYNIRDKNCKTTNILKAFIKETGKNKRHLAYRFFMMKPKEILVLVDDDAIENINETSDLEKLLSTLVGHGIWLKSNGDKEIEGIEKFDDTAIYEHEILLNLTKSKIEHSIGLLPDRIIKPDNSVRIIWIKQLANANDNESANSFKEKVWIEFRKQLSKIYIRICLFNNSDESLSFGHVDPPRIMASFDHHGSSWKSTLFPDFSKGEIQYLEVTSGLNNLTDVLRKAACIREINRNQVNHSRDEVVYSKLLGSIDAQIIIIDERIQQAAYSLKYSPEASTESISFNELYIASGIYVPHPKNDFNFSKISYVSKNGETSAKEQVKSLLKKTEAVFLNNGINTNFKRTKFLVIHLGVLEKILNAEGKRKSDPEKERETINELVEELKDALSESLKGEVKPVIVSGRGLPPNLPRAIPYISYSGISQYMIDNRNKYLLTELLLSTRKIN